MRILFAVAALTMVGAGCPRADEETGKQGAQVQIAENTWRTDWELTVQPAKGEVVLATYREVKGVDVVKDDSKDYVRVERLIYVPSGSYTECLSHFTKGRFQKDTARSFVGSQVVSGFGQTFRVNDLDLDGVSGASAEIGGEDHRSPRSALRRFRFTNHVKNGQPEQTHNVEFSLRLLSQEEAAFRLKEAKLALPSFEGRGWSLTLPSQ